MKINKMGLYVSLLFLEFKESVGNVKYDFNNKTYRIPCQVQSKTGGFGDIGGCTPETIVNLENGRHNPSLKLAMDIAKVFSCTVEDLFIFEEEEKT